MSPAHDFEARVVEEMEAEQRGACYGNPTISDGDMERCQLCERGVAWDLIDHPFFEFKADCQHFKKKPIK